MVGCSRLRLLVIILFAVAVIAAVRHRHNSVSIGFLGELSGRGSVFGIAGYNGALLAVEQANASGGVNGRSVELVAVSYQDGHGDVLQSLEQLERAGVEAIIGPMTSEASMKLMSPEPQTDLVLVSPTSETSQLAGIPDQFFRIAPASNISVRLLVSHLLEERVITRVSIVRDTDNEAFTRDWQEEFGREYTRRGGVVVEVIPYSSRGLTSFLKLSARIAAGGAQGVLLLSHAMDTALFCQQVAKQQLSLACFCTSWASSPLLTQMGGSGVEGLTWVQGSRYDDTTPPYLEFCRSYRERFGTAPDYAALHAYEAGQMLLEALKGDPNVPLARRLVELEVSIGPQDTLVINPNGDVVRELHLLSIRNGQIVSVGHSRAPFALLLN